MTTEEFNPAPLNAMLWHHDGYIRALEDLLKDYQRMMRSGTFSRERIHAAIVDSLDEATRSREAVRNMLNSEGQHA